MKIAEIASGRRPEDSKWWEELRKVEFLDKFNNKRYRESALDDIVDGKIKLKSWVDELNIDCSHGFDIPPDAWQYREFEYVHFHSGNFDINFVPPCKNLMVTSGCTVKNLRVRNDISTDALEFVSFNHLEPNAFQCGLLGLLKWPALKEVRGISIPTKEMREALKIVQKHLKDRDTLECQNELIDAGFEEWAKL